MAVAACIRGINAVFLTPTRSEDPLGIFGRKTALSKGEKRGRRIGREERKPRKIS